MRLQARTRPNACHPAIVGQTVRLVLVELLSLFRTPFGDQHSLHLYVPFRGRMAEGEEKLTLKDSSLEMWDSIWSGEYYEQEEGQGEGHEECHMSKEVQRYVRLCVFPRVISYERIILLSEMAT